MESLNMQLTSSQAERFYAEHRDKPFFTGLVSFMTSGPVWALVLAREDAIKAWRQLMGPTNPQAARESAPKRYAADAMLRVPARHVQPSLQPLAAWHTIGP
jgi:nucleoside diphosphate kinase